MLIVTRPFGFYRRGDAITDSADIASVQAGVFRDHAVSIAAPAAAVPASAPTIAQAVAAGVAAAEATLHPAAR